MNLKKVYKQYVLRFSGEFDPKVRLGSNLKIGSLLGIGDYFRVLQEVPLAAINEILVDDGMFVTKGTELAISVELFKKEIFTADFDGMVRITKEALQIVEVELNHEYFSRVAGRVEFVSNEKIKIKAAFYKYWLFASIGNFVKGEMYFVDVAKPIITTRDLTSSIKGHIVVIPSFLTRRLIIKAIELGAIGIIGASIDYSEFSGLSNVIRYINLGVLMGFGNIALSSNIYSFFKLYHGQYLEVDFSREFVYMPVREVFANRKNFLVFSGTNWGTSVHVENLEDNNFITVKKVGKVVKTFQVKVAEVFVS